MLSWIWEDKESRIMSMFLAWITEWMMVAIPELEEHRRSRFGGKFIFAHAEFEVALRHLNGDI